MITTSNIIPHKTPAPNVKYSHAVWGVDVDSHPLAAVNGRKHFGSAPVPVFKKVHKRVVIEVN